MKAFSRENETVIVNYDSNIKAFENWKHLYYAILTLTKEFFHEERVDVPYQGQEKAKKQSHFLLAWLLDAWKVKRLKKVCKILTFNLVIEKGCPLGLDSGMSTIWLN